MELISTKVCKTSDIGVNENLFGGRMLAWLDESGAIMACDKANTKSVVTLKIEEVIFKLPVKVSDHIRIYGEIVKVGNSSITLSLEARRRNFSMNDFGFTTKNNVSVFNGKLNTETVVCSTNIIFVQIDKNGNSLKFIESQLKKLNA